MNRVVLILEFEKYLKDHYGTFEKEVVFSSIMPTKRKFRADYFLREKQIIIELNGGEYMMGRHTRAKGYQDDLIKADTAQKNGFVYYQFTYTHLQNLTYREFI